MSTNYCNANEFLPQELIGQVLAHLPADRRERVLLYIHRDYYGARDTQVVRAYEHAVREARYATRGDLYAALGNAFALSPRRIYAIVQKRRSAQGGAVDARRVRYCSTPRENLPRRGGR